MDNLRKTDKVLWREKLNDFIKEYQFITITREVCCDNPQPATLDIQKNRLFKIKINLKYNKALEKWWICEFGHSFISNEENPTTESCDYCHDVTDFYDRYYLTWDDSKRSFSSPYDLQFSYLQMGVPMKSRKRRKSGGYEPITDEFLKSLSPTQYWWTCFKCYGEWGNGLGFTRIANDEDDSVYDFTKTGHEILKYEDYEFDICRMYGLCPKCNSSRLIIGFNNLSRYAGTKYSPLQWLHATKNKDINLNFINTSTFSIYETKLWWSCPAQHEWENSFMRECHRYAAHYCYYENCRLPLNKREHDIIDGLNLHSIFSEWDKERNPSLITYSGEMDYSAFSTYSFTTYWWKCSKNDKHVWQDTLWQRMKNPTCSECFPSGESLVEIDFYDELKKHIPDLTRKHWVEGLYWSSGHGKNKMVADMVSVNHRVAIEYDGYAYHSGIRTKSEYEVHEKRDMEKTEAFIKTGWKVVRIREGELKFLQAREGLHQVNHHFVNNRFSSQYDNSVKKTVNEILTIKDLIY